MSKKVKEIIKGFLASLEMTGSNFFCHLDRALFSLVISTNAARRNPLIKRDKKNIIARYVACNVSTLHLNYKQSKAPLLKSFLITKHNNKI